MIGSFPLSFCSIMGIVVGDGRPFCISYSITARVSAKVVPWMWWTAPLSASSLRSDVYLLLQVSPAVFIPLPPGQCYPQMGTTWQPSSPLPPQSLLGTNVNLNSCVCPPATVRDIFTRIFCCDLSAHFQSRILICCRGALRKLTPSLP